MAYRIVKASVKAVLVYLLYFCFTSLTASIMALLPGLAESIGMFSLVFIVLMVLGDLTEGTMFQFFFGTAKALFVVFYLILNLKNGVINLTLENLSLTADLTQLYIIATLLSLLGLSRAILQFINFMNEKAESTIQSIH